MERELVLLSGRRGGKRHSFELVAATFAVVQWLIRIGGQCEHVECFRSLLSRRETCRLCGEEVTRAR